MKDKIFGVLQRVGRSFMLPIAILPVAGLLLGIGSSFTNATTIETYGLTKILGDGTLLHSLMVIMNSVGSAVFNNLPLIFAVGEMCIRDRTMTAGVGDFANFLFGCTFVVPAGRSEERRVGKECRSRWSPYH